MNIVSDLRFAQRTCVAVVIDLMVGDELLVGVHDVDENAGFVTVSSTNRSDGRRTRRIDLESIRAVAITDMKRGDAESDG